MKNMKFYKTIILPVEDSDFSQKAADRAIALAESLSIPLKVIYVVDMNIFSNTLSNDQMSVQWENVLKNEGRSILDEIKNKAEERGIQVSTHIEKGNPPDKILKYADDEDLIIMGSKGKNTLDRIFIGSTSENVLHHAGSSVMIVR